MNYLYALPWLVWALWFVGWEAWGFRKNRDKWPTLSQLWKWWEGHSEETQKHGVIVWTPFRWFTAIGLPVAAVLLEAHWVWEWF